MSAPNLSTVVSVGQQVGGPSRLSSVLQALQPPLGLAMRFDVVIGSLSLGSWSSCKGLSVAFKPETVRELGTNGFRRILMPDIEYSPVVLERAMDSKNSPAVLTWLTTQVRAWLTAKPTGEPYAGDTARITLYNAKAGPVASWTLWGVYPSRWVGPTLSGRESTVAIETLELVHEGFLPVAV